MVYSPKQQAWLVFFEVTASVNPAKAAGSGIMPGLAAAAPPGSPPADAGSTTAAGAAAGPTGGEAAPASGPISIGGEATNFNAAIAAFLAASNAGQAPSITVQQQQGPGPQAAGGAGAGGGSSSSPTGDRGGRAGGAFWEFALIKAGQPNKEMVFLPGEGVTLTLCGLPLLLLLFIVSIN
jgi:hypothetical protein